tara:strand:- start:105 stop:329 length:225 start_codon:yes stop_codon:yes gene_type:complete
MDKTARPDIILFEFLNLNKKFNPINRTKGIKIYIAGYMLNAAMNSPCIMSANDLCIPHPGHSTPKSVLFKQGNI